jgi:hypothetical protein
MGGWISYTFSCSSFWVSSFTPTIDFYRLFAGIAGCCLGGGVLALVAYFAMTAAYGDITFEWAQLFVVPWSIILIFIFTIMSWGWALFALYLAMKYLDLSNKWLVYGNETIMPFYLLHQPVIIVITYFVVQWDASLLAKLLVVIIGSLLVTLGLIELLVRPFKPMRMLFGMKARRRKGARA